MAKVGRKSSYTPEIHNQIVEILATGVSITDVCAYIGISETTYKTWCNKFPAFLAATSRARTEARVGAAGVIKRSALGDSKKGISANTEDAKWYLERTDPQTWGRTTKIILNVEPNLQKQLQQLATERGIDLGALFRAWIDELSDSDGNSEE